MKPIIYTSLLIMLSVTHSIATQSNFQVMGRVLWEQDTCMMAYPGIVLQTNFTGTDSISLDAGIVSGEDSFFNVWLNGIQMRTLRIEGARKSYRVASQLDPSQSYHLRLVRRSEAWQGVVRIHGLEAAESATWLPPHPLPVRRLLVIGDSITCGAAVEVKKPYTRDGNHHSNAEASYGFVLAKMFNAQVHLVSYGGKGLIRDWQGLESEITAPQFFERTHPDQTGYSWDHSRYTPDLVLICLGQNDFSTGIIDESVYVPTYIAFCERILQVHPKTRLLLCSSPMQGANESKRHALEAYLDKVAAHFNSGEIDRVHAFRNKCYDGTELNSHPTEQQHQQMAHDLYPVVGEWMGWLD